MKILAVLLALLGLSSLGGWLAYRIRQRRTPDEAWKAQTPVQRYSGFDPDKAITSKRAADQRYRLRTKLEARRSESAEIVEIRKAR